MYNVEADSSEAEKRQRFGWVMIRWSSRPEKETGKDLADRGAQQYLQFVSEGEMNDGLTRCSKEVALIVRVCVGERECTTAKA